VKINTAGAIAILLGLVIIGIIVLALAGRPIPDTLPLLATMLGGALVGRMLPTGASSSGRTPGDNGARL
jgi:hypothetical protein